MAERRDIRHFNGSPLDINVFKKILSAAHMAPSVGLMQPWRFIRVTDMEKRQSIWGIVEKERQLTAEAMGEKKLTF